MQLGLCFWSWFGWYSLSSVQGVLVLKVAPGAQEKMSQPQESYTVSSPTFSWLLSELTEDQIAKTDCLLLGRDSRFCVHVSVWHRYFYLMLFPPWYFFLGGGVGRECFKCWRNYRLWKLFYENNWCLKLPCAVKLTSNFFLNIFPFKLEPNPHIWYFCFNFSINGNVLKITWRYIVIPFNVRQN